MNDTSIILLLAFLASLIAVMTPILKLNSAITKLNITIDTINKSLLDSDKIHSELDHRVQDHEIRIDRLEHK